MIISNTKKKKPYIIDNIQKLVDSAGETQFKNIYKNLQPEIKDKIITKLLTKLDFQNKQIEKYKEEILSLKNDLVYLLKRVIISKNEEKINSINSKLKKHYNKINNNFSSLSNNYDTSTFSPSSHISSQLKSFSQFYNQTENNNNINNKVSFDISNINPMNNAQNEIDIKINNYINSIYKHNFAKNETNINDYYSLNKKENIFEEIFQKKVNNKNNELYIGTDPCYNKKNHLHNNRSQRNILSTMAKRPNESIEERKKNKKLSSSMINIKNKYEDMTDYKDNDKHEEYKDDENERVNMHKMKGKMNIIIKNNNYGNKYLKVKKKNEDANDNNSENENKISKNKSFKNKTQQNGFYSVTGGNKIKHNTSLKKKIQRNHHYIPMNRSPFLANKF